MSAYAYFIRWRGGKYEVVPIHEHETNVRQAPEKYGLDQEFIDDVDKQFTDLNDRRREIILQVMRNGWMRVRDHGANKGITFEFISMGNPDKALEAIAKFGKDEDFKPTQWLRVTDLQTRPTRTKEMSWKSFLAADGDEEKLLGSKLEKKKDDEEDSLFSAPEMHTLPPMLKPKRKHIWEPTGSPVYRAAKAFQKTGVDWPTALDMARKAYGQREGMESGEMTLSERIERVAREADRIANQPISEGCAEDEISVMKAMGASMRCAWKELRGADAKSAGMIAMEIQKAINETKRPSSGSTTVADILENVAVQAGELSKKLAKPKSE